MQHDSTRREYVARYNREHPRPNASARIIGIDGEGQGRGEHVYNYLAAADENGEVWSIGDDPNRQIGTEECLDFILGLPSRSLIFGFAFLYDLTKILEDLPDSSLWLLLRPEKRAYLNRKTGRVLYRPEKWRGYTLNYMHRRFTVQKGSRRATVWDIFAFFQKRFTQALIDWKIGKKADIEAMERMKEKRSVFNRLPFSKIQVYCNTECKHLAQLGRAIIDAHEDAGFALKSYFGAGSTASSLLSKYDVQEYKGEIPDAMKEPVACAFFGGRFENSVIGPIERPVWNYDISSAYPYALTMLPCLRCGRWKRCTRNLENEIERATLALVKWHLPKGPEAPWGPLPVRNAKGGIIFPLGAHSGYSWKAEFLAARRLAPQLIPTETWVYTTDCAHAPFQFLPAVYSERCRIGKEGKGLVLKLGPNSIYGKTVQTVGFAPPFQSFVWGGNTTSSCRAQCLDGIRLAPRPENVLMIATDGLWSDAPIDLPAPIDTGTGATGKPLGGWEMKHFPGGMFAARPGVYFPLNATEDDIEKVRARGLGRKVLYERRERVIEAFLNGETVLDSKGKEVPGVTIDGGQRFIGAKTGVRWSRETGAVRDENYGRWIDWSVNVTFDPRPKRRAVRNDRTLVCWDNYIAPSMPYAKALRDEEAELMELAQIIAEEQPNADYVED